MANSLCFTPLTSVKPPRNPGLIDGDFTARRVLWINHSSQNCKNAGFQSFRVNAADSNQSTKPNSIVCADCEGNGAVACSQCKGTGVNSEDHFNGRFKAGGLCWLCRGKKDILCGNCNGAGFVGGFMSTLDS
ncbi:hypothetical protein U1Q18_028401 [Sarracenia purpurea var. burkii]